MHGTHSQTTSNLETPSLLVVFFTQSMDMTLQSLLEYHPLLTFLNSTIHAHPEKNLLRGPRWAERPMSDTPSAHTVEDPKQQQRPHSVILRGVNIINNELYFSSYENIFIVRHFKGTASSIQCRLLVSIYIR